MNLGGSLTRQIEQDAAVSEASPHIANIGEDLPIIFLSSFLLWMIVIKRKSFLMRHASATIFVNSVAEREPWSRHILLEPEP